MPTIIFLLSKLHNWSLWFTRKMRNWSLAGTNYRHVPRKTTCFQIGPSPFTLYPFTLGTKCESRQEIPDEPYTIFTFLFLSINNNKKAYSLVLFRWKRFFSDTSPIPGFTLTSFHFFNN